MAIWRPKKMPAIGWHYYLGYQIRRSGLIGIQSDGCSDFAELVNLLAADAAGGRHGGSHRQCACCNAQPSTQRQAGAGSALFREKGRNGGAGIGHHGTGHFLPRLCDLFRWFQYKCSCRGFPIPDCVTHYHQNEYDAMVAHAIPEMTKWKAQSRPQLRYR
ncbi:hypothetical protein [Noviherbaspirillum soli]|uniref:hypothetical protein n=1 Tax=Noviherbaspirillum soli TaxID=1064518 RepID=UPI001E425CAC|nr:hypothetical protein [Noviherbaspirillum soli]